jgi:hypothetical protein
MSNLMEYKGYKARIMEAPRLTGDQIHGLPPGTPLEIYPVDVFKKAPENWMKGPGVFCVPVRPNKGLWFDWRGNSEVNTAVIPTVKGCNPITGLQTTGFHLERYDRKCPKHNYDFLTERFCPECNYKWPDRNYQSLSPSWWDGFRADDGCVRQFFFSEDELRDIASGLIGRENTIPAFGFAFYSPKIRRPEAQTMIGGFNNTFIYPFYYSSIENGSSGTSITCSNSYGAIGGAILNNSFKIDGPDVPIHSVYCCSAGTPTASGLSDSDYGSISEVKNSIKIPNERSRQKTKSLKSFSAAALVKEVSIGAGAKISQSLNSDTSPIDEWKDAPDAVMTIYFIFQDKFDEIVTGGLRDLSGVNEGMLAKLPVG